MPQTPGVQESVGVGVVMEVVVAVRVEVVVIVEGGRVVLMVVVWQGKEVGWG